MKKNHTPKSVRAEMIKEFANLSTTDWSEAGDVNMEEYGGVRYRKSGSEIEIQFYRGLDVAPASVPDMLCTKIDLDDCLDAVSLVWSFADVDACGLSIGDAIQSRQLWDGFLSEMSGWEFSDPPERTGCTGCDSGLPHYACMRG